MSTSKIDFQFEPISALLDEGIADLVEQHWQEIALDKDEIPLDVDWDKKQLLEDQGAWKAWVARHNGFLIGYISFYIHEHAINYKSTRYIHDDVFWLHPDYRNAGVGKAMIQSAIEALPRPSKLQMKVKLTFEGGRVGKLLEHLGLPAVEQVHSAYLK